MVYAQAAAVFLLPLILTPHLLFYYDITPKVALLMLAAALGLAASVFRADSWAAYTRRRSGRWFLCAAAVSMAIAGIAAWRSPDPALAWYGSNWRRMGALTDWAVMIAALWMAASAIASRRNLAVLLRALCAAGLLASLYGMAQYLGWDPLLPRSDYSVGEGVFQIVRPPGTLGHSDYFAAFLLWPVFVGLALAGMERVPVWRWPGWRWLGWRWLGWISAAAGSVAIVLSGSRGALLGLCCGAVVRVLLHRPPWRGALRIGAAAVAAFALFYVSPEGERLRARVHWIAEDPAGGARPLLWRDALGMAGYRPFTGFGPDDFSAAFPKFESEDLARAYPDFYHESPHNLLLDVLTGEGAMGLLALALMAAIAIAGALRARLANPRPALAFLPGLAAALTAHQFAVCTAPNAFFFYFACGSLAIAGSASESSSMPRLWRPVLSAAALAGCALFAISAYRLLAQDAMLAAINRHLDRGDAAAAAQAYRAALTQRDAGVAADLYLSRRFSRVAMSTTLALPKLYYSQIAMGAAARATRQPEQLANAWFNLSVLAAANRDATGAEYALRAASAAAPNWYKPHWILARLLASENRAGESIAQARRALQLNAGRDAEVASTLAGVERSAGSEP